jgi:hypothetical protein
MPASRKTIAVVFGAVGGLSDVGKMAVLQLLDGASSVDLRSVLMFHSSERPSLTAANRPIVRSDFFSSSSLISSFVALPPFPPFCPGWL